jgi:hypothetical protein
MPDPYDYSSAFANLPAPGDSFLAGIKNGVSLNQLQAQQEQQRAALAQQQQKQQVIQSLIANPNASADDYAKAAVLVPELSAQFKQAWDTKSTAQAQNDLRNMVEWSSAIQSGQPKIASDGMRTRADAIENTAGGPTPESKALRAKADQVDANPQAANVILKSMIAANPNGKAAIDGIVAQNGDARAQTASDSKAAADASDLYLKNQGIIAQQAGAIAKPGVKPAQAIAMFKSMEARGILPKGGAQDYIDAMPADAKDLPDYLAGVRDTGITAKEQKAYTTPDANAQLSARTQVQTTGMNNATQLKVQQMIADRQDSKGDTEPTLDPDTLRSMAEQYVDGGDKSVLQNLGRGAQGAANIVALRGEITKVAKERGLSGAQIAARMAEFAGTMAGQRTAGTRIANIEMAANEAQSLIPLARQASAEVPRSAFLPAAKGQIWLDKQTNDPAVRKFVAANNSLVNVYARAISPSGAPTVSDKDHAREMLATAFDDKSYQAVLDQMEREISAARQAPQAVRSSFSAGVSGQGHGAVPPAAASHPADISALLSKYGKK